MLYQQILAKPAEQYPESAAVVLNDTVISYAALKVQVDIVAENLWRLDVRAGDFLSTYLPNCLENLVFNLALFKLGAVSVPIRAQLQADDIEHIAFEADIKMVVTSLSLLPELEKALGDMIKRGRIQCITVAPGTSTPDWARSFSSLQVPHNEQLLPDIAVNPDDISTVLYTSGSTGLPKGAVHTQRQWVENAMLSANDFVHGDVTYGALSINHAYGFGEQVLPALLKGATLMLMNGFKPTHFLQAVISGLNIEGNTFQVTSFYGVPSMYHNLAKLGDAVFEGLEAHRLKYLDFAGDVLPVLTRARIQTLFGPILRVTYGMSEAMRISRGLLSLDTDVLPVIGEIAPGVSIKIYKTDGTEAGIGEAGELCICGPAVCHQYLRSTKREEETINGHFKTGDIVKLDDLGQLVYVNRSKRIIVTAGGYNINPSDIESTLTQHPLVAQSCAFSIFDKTERLLIVALATLASEADGVSAALLFELFNTVQAQHRPNIVACIDKFELGSTGKIKWQLHQEHAAQAFATPEENSPLYYDSRNIESAAP